MGVVASLLFWLIDWPAGLADDREETHFGGEMNKKNYVGNVYSLINVHYFAQFKSVAEHSSVRKC